MSDVTQILTRIEGGDPEAADELLPLVYSELRQLAAAHMAREPSEHTLQPTALVHEAYLRLVESGDAGWDNRRHFFAAAAEAMRRILVEKARQRQSLKRGGNMVRHELMDSVTAGPLDDGQLLVLDEALHRLAETDSQAAEVVKLRYFSGLTVAEVAAALSMSTRSVDRIWAFAKAWLLDAMCD